MATTRSFSDMLNEYLPNKLLKEELVKRDYCLSKVEKDDGWLGGTLIVPFKAAGASSVAFGALTGESDIAEDKYVRGQVSTQKELWGSMKFNHRDLMEHDRVSEKNFLKILPDAVEDFMQLMKNAVSINLLSGAHISKATAATTAADGVVAVANPDRFQIGQKVILAATADVVGYVRTISMDDAEITLYDARTGGSALSFAANAVAVGDGIYHPSSDSTSATAIADSFSSLKDALLSAANGGSATLYGQTKTAYPYLQAINVSGAAITSSIDPTVATNIMASIFDALTTIRRLGRGNPTECVMSYKNLAQCMKVIEASKGAFNVQPGSQKASQFGWTELVVGSVAHGGLKLVGVQEMDDDAILVMDWRGVKFHSNGFFRKRKSPDGTEYFELRDTTGYSYIIDVCLFGELVVTRPSYSGIIHSISY